MIRFYGTAKSMCYKHASKEFTVALKEFKRMTNSFENKWRIKVIGFRKLIPSCTINVF